MAIFPKFTTRKAVAKLKVIELQLMSPQINYWSSPPAPLTLTQMSAPSPMLSR